MSWLIAKFIPKGIKSAFITTFHLLIFSEDIDTKTTQISAVNNYIFNELRHVYYRTFEEYVKHLEKRSKVPINKITSWCIKGYKLLLPTGAAVIFLYDHSKFPRTIYWPYSTILILRLINWDKILNLYANIIQRYIHHEMKEHRSTHIPWSWWRKIISWYKM